MGIEGICSRFSVAVVADENGTILSSERLDLPLSLHTTARPMLRSRLIRLMRAVLQPIDLRLDNLQDMFVCIGLSGVTFPYNASVDVPRLFDEMGVSTGRLICTPDTHIIFASHAQTNQGSVITCSMGSMAYATTPSGVFRVGGWGPTLGDEGSAYWMGRAVLRAIGEESDINASDSRLWKEVQQFLNDPEKVLPAWKEHSILWKQRCHLFQKYGADPRTVIFSFAHDLSIKSTADWRSLASSLVIPLMKAWRKGDRTAEMIVNESARALVKQFMQVCDKAKVRPDHGPLVLYGGVFTYHPDFRDAVRDRIERKCKCPVHTILIDSPRTMRPACGALLFALGESETSHLRLPDRNIIERLVNQDRWHYTGALVND